MEKDIPPPAIRMTIDSRLEYVFLIGRALRGICRHLGFDESEAYQIELCAVEAANNAIIHAYGNRPGHRVEARFRVNPENVIVEISHTGTSPEALPETETAPDAGISDPSSLSETGRGLFIIRSVMDETRYVVRDDKTVLIMTKSRPDNRPAPSHR